MLDKEGRMRSMQAALIAAAWVIMPSALHAQASVIEREFEGGISASASRTTR